MKHMGNRNKWVLTQIRFRWIISRETGGEICRFTMRQLSLLFVNQRWSRVYGDTDSQFDV